MKYPRGTILKFTHKALTLRRDCHVEDRIIVLDDHNGIWYRGLIVMQLSMRFSHDSFVTPANEERPRGLTLRPQEDMNAALMLEFGIGPPAQEANPLDKVDEYLKSFGIDRECEWFKRAGDAFYFSFTKEGLVTAAVVTGAVRVQRYESTHGAMIDV